MPIFFLFRSARDQLAVLRDWLKQHASNPYPTIDEKHDLALQTNLTYEQVSNWYAILPISFFLALHPVHDVDAILQVCECEAAVSPGQGRSVSSQAGAEE